MGSARGDSPRPPRRGRGRRRSTTGTAGAGIGPDLLDLIRRAFPDGIVELPADFDEIDADALYPGLRRRLAAVEGAGLAYEREPSNEPSWSDEDERWDDSPADLEHSRSYLLLFLAPADERFHYATEDTVEDEEGTRTAAGTGTIGCTVAISLLAPVALVKFDDLEVFDDGGETLPEAGDNAFDLEGHPLDPNLHFRAMFGAEIVDALQILADRITAILTAQGVMVLSREQLESPVPGLVAGEETLIGDLGSGVTVREAFFFEQL
jgi:hypothetical protein